MQVMKMGMNEYYETKGRSRVGSRETCNVKDEEERQQVSISAHINTQQPAQPASVHHRSLPHKAATTDKSQHVVSSDGLCRIMQRQNDITEMLVKQQNVSQLPQRDVPIFSGDPLSYRSFIRAFEQATETKTTNPQDRSFYLQQFTDGEPCNLVRSCEHMRPDEGYREAVTY